MSQIDIRDELQNAKTDPWLPIETKLAGWSLGLGVGLLILAIPYRRWITSRALLVPITGIALVLLAVVWERRHYFEVLVRSRVQTGGRSENAHFAEVCRSCKIEFIGPPHEAMRRLGNKNEARKLAKEAGVPVVPGSEGLVESDGDAVRLAHTLGFPVLIKAAAGGGGRGMRVARNDISLQAGLKAARQEAEKAFKDGTVYLEKYL